MQILLQKIFRPFFVWVAIRFGAAPSREVVFKSLTRLYYSIAVKKSNRGIVVISNAATDKFIIFSDQHKGNKDAADDFKNNEPNYIAALTHYQQQGYCFINLGDAEELWKYTADKVIPQNQNALKAEANFQQDNKYIRTFGNHDLLWKSKLDVSLYLKKAFPLPLVIYEGIVLKMLVSPYEAQAINEKQKTINIFLTHGHQGDTMSDNNAFSSWMVAHIWLPIQRFLKININTPANDFQLRNKHNKMMYEWSSRRKDLLLVTGHTHRPVFASGKYAADEAHKIGAEKYNAGIKPTYFNTGCCCFDDGDITGIEIAAGYIRLIKWHNDNNTAVRTVLEEKLLLEICNDLL